MENKEERVKLILEVLDMIRQYLMNDGGDVEFVELHEDGVVDIRLLGACVGCGMADITVYQGIEESLVEEVPGVIGVNVVSDQWL